MLVGQGELGVFRVVSVVRPVPLSTCAYPMVHTVAFETQMQGGPNLHQNEAYARHKPQQRRAPFEVFSS
ncbi:MAG: hypothetical protein CMJ98_02840 [Planctomycetes bacterium]|nr:hypothetical protein [Planctomycetota bacterium]